MASVAPRAFAILALLVVCLEMSSGPLSVQADPGLKDKRSQLKTLALDGLGGGTGSGTSSNPELTEFLGACVAMSLRSSGMTGKERPKALLGALRKMVNNMSPAKAAKIELWRMVAVCVTDFKEDEFGSFKLGKVQILPEVYVDEAKKPEAETKVLAIDDQVWKELRKISEGLVNELVVTKVDTVDFNASYLAFIPFLALVCFIAYGLNKMLKANEEKASKKERKAAKKAN